MDALEQVKAIERQLASPDLSDVDRYKLQEQLCLVRRNAKLAGEQLRDVRTRPPQNPRIT